jgi:predicted dehydrogenase
VVIRGMGSIGARHAAIAVEHGHAVAIWPVRTTSNRQPISGATLIDHYPDRGPAVDLAIIATATDRHIPDAIAALDAGAQRVLVEKPLCASLADAERLLIHPDRDRVVVASQLRFRVGFQALTDFASGKRLRSARITCQSWLPDWRPEQDYRTGYGAGPSGGALLDLVHEIDYTKKLFGMPTALNAVLSPVGAVSVLGLASEESAELLWLLADNSAQVSMRLDYISRPGQRRLEAFFDGASSSWDLLSGELRFWTSDSGLRIVNEGAAELAMSTAVSRQLLAIFADHEDSAGAAASLATLEDGLAAVEICDAARVSSRERQWVQLDPAS